MGSLATISVHNNLSTSKTCITVRATDYEFAGRIHVKDDIITEKLLCPLWKLGHHTGKKDIPYILLDLCLHGSIIRVKLIVLGRYHNGVYPDGLMVVIILDGELTL